MSIKTMIIDKDALTNPCIVHLIQDTDIEVNSTVKSVLEAEDTLKSCDVDIILINIDSLLGHSVYWIENILEAFPSLKVLMMVPDDHEMEDVLACLSVGAKGFVSINTESKLFLRSIKKVIEGEVWVPRTMVNQIIKTITHLESLNTEDKVKIA